MLSPNQIAGFSDHVSLLKESKRVYFYIMFALCKMKHINGFNFSKAVTDIPLYGLSRALIFDNANILNIQI